MFIDGHCLSLLDARVMLELFLVATVVAGATVGCNNTHPTAGIPELLLVINQGFWRTW